MIRRRTTDPREDQTEAEPGGLELRRLKWLRLAMIPLCLTLVLGPRIPGPMSKSSSAGTKKALCALRRAFDDRNQPDLLFEPAFRDAQRSVYAISPDRNGWWRSIETDWRVKQKAGACITHLQSYREDLRFAEVAIGAAKPGENDAGGEFDQTLVDAEQQAQDTVRCLSDIAEILH